MNDIAVVATAKNRDRLDNKDRTHRVNEIIAMLKTQEYVKDKAEMVELITALYKSLTNGKTLLRKLQENVKLPHRKYTGLEKIILTDIFNLLTKNTKPTSTFGMYIDLIDPENDNNTIKTRYTEKVVVRDESVLLRPSDELNFLFNTLGIEETGYLILLLTITPY